MWSAWPAASARASVRLVPAMPASAKNARTTSWVPSVEPVSTTTQWSRWEATAARVSATTWASSRTIMLRQTVGRTAGRSDTSGGPGSMGAEGTRAGPDTPPPRSRGRTAGQTGPGHR